MSVVDTYQYPDPEDAFSREPFVVKFSAPRSGEAPPSRGPHTPAPAVPGPASDPRLPQLPGSSCSSRCTRRRTRPWRRSTLSTTCTWT